MSSPRHESSSDTASSSTETREEQSSRAALIDLTSPSSHQQDSTNVPDRRLAHWEAWLRTRELTQRHVGEKVRRAPRDMCMNSFEELRAIKEEKQILEYSRIIEIDNPYRFALKYPKALSNRNKPELPVCTRQTTLPDQGIIPPMEHVGVPTYIQREKWLIGDTTRRTPKQIWDSNSYLQQVKEKNAYELNRVSSHFPQTNNLIVVGNESQEIPNNIARTDRVGFKGSKEIPTIVLTSCDGEFKPEQDDTSANGEVSDSNTHYVCLLVNGIKCEWENQANRENIIKVRSCDSVFCYDTRQISSINLLFYSSYAETTINYLRMENMGNVKITYAWRKNAREYEDFPKIHTTHQSPFYFNKNDGMILPGQIIEFPFWFRSPTPGIFAETWILSTTPPLFIEGQIIGLKLWACGTRLGLSNKSNPELISGVDEYLQTHSSQSIAEEQVNEVVRRAISICAPEITLTENFSRDFVKKVSKLYGCSPPDVRAWDASLESQYHITSRRLKKHEVIYGFLCNCIDSIETEAVRLKELNGICKISADLATTTPSSEEFDVSMFTYLSHMVKPANKSSEKVTDDASDELPVEVEVEEYKDVLKLSKSDPKIPAAISFSSRLKESAVTKAKATSRLRAAAARDSLSSYAPDSDVVKPRAKVIEMASPPSESDTVPVVQTLFPEGGFDLRLSDSLILAANKYHRESQNAQPNTVLRSLNVRYDDSKSMEELEDVHTYDSREIAAKHPRYDAYLGKLHNAVYERLRETVDQMVLHIDAINSLSKDVVAAYKV